MIEWDDTRDDRIIFRSDISEEDLARITAELRAMSRENRVLILPWPRRVIEVINGRIEPDLEDTP